MHSITEFGTNIPAFLTKLWRMVDDPSWNDLITWGPTGTSFVIKDQSRFAREVLPMYYKHNNMASFIRQLNMYGFHKIVSVESGCAKMEVEEMEFHHSCFIKDQPHMLEHIKRKINTSRVAPAVPNPATRGQAEVVNKVLHDVRRMRSRQDSVDSQLTQMKMENEALWREIAILRQKHMKQQQIVNKLIQFLVSIVQHQHPHTNGIGVKRRTFPLMLQDHTASGNHLNKNNQNVGGISEMTRSPTGPVIHEIEPNDYATLLLNNVNVDNCIPTSSAESADSCVNQEPVIENEALDTGDIAPQEGDDDLENNDELMDLPNHFLAESSIPSAEKSSELSNPPEQSKQSFVRPLKIRGNVRKRRPRKATVTKKMTAANDSLQHIDSPEQAAEQADISGLVINGEFPLIIPETQALEDLTAAATTLNAEDIDSTSTVDLSALAEPMSSTTIDSSTPIVIDSPVPIVTSPYDSTSAVDLSALAKPMSRTTIDSSTPIVIDSPVPIVTSPYSDIGELNAADSVPVLATALIQVPPSIITNTAPAPAQAPAVVTPKTKLRRIAPKSGPASSSLVSIRSQIPKKRQAPIAKASTVGKKQKCAPHTIAKSVTPITSKLLNFASTESKATDSKKIKSNEEKNDMTVACMSPSNSQSPFRQEIDNHVDTLQNDLETLKELLKGESISLDANTLLGLFNSDDPMSYTMSDLPAQNQDKSKETGNELVSYSNPNQELGDLFDYNDWILSPPTENLNEEDEFIIPEVNTPDILMTPEPQYTPTASKKKKK